MPAPLPPKPSKTKSLVWPSASEKGKMVLYVSSRKRPSIARMDSLPIEAGWMPMQVRLDELEKEVAKLGGR